MWPIGILDQAARHWHIGQNMGGIDGLFIATRQEFQPMEKGEEADHCSRSRNLCLLWAGEQHDCRSCVAGCSGR